MSKEKTNEKKCGEDSENRVQKFIQLAYRDGLNDGLSVARDIADWMNGLDRQVALRQIERKAHFLGFGQPNYHQSKQPESTESETAPEEG